MTLLNSLWYGRCTVRVANTWWRMRRAVIGCWSLLTVGGRYKTPVRQTVDFGEVVRTLGLSLESSALESRSEDGITSENDIMLNVLASTYLRQARVEMVEVVRLMDKRQRYKLNTFTTL